MKINYPVIGISAAASALIAGFILMRKRKKEKQILLQSHAIKKPKRHLTNVFHNAKAHINGSHHSAELY